MEETFNLLLYLTLFSFLSLFNLTHSQQTYLNNTQLACYNNNFNNTLGYVCNSTQTSRCTSYLTFRSTALYDSAVMISYLLSSDPESIASIRNISSVDKIPINNLIVVPVNCSCTGRFYQHNSSYTIKYTGETYLQMANNTYQGLSTCQAMMAQNTYESTSLVEGMTLLVPLRCACPSSKQISDGVKFLLSYLVEFGDDVSTIAQRFGVDEQSVLDANELDSNLIYPFTPLLIPLKTAPTPNLTTEISASPPASSPPTQSTAVPVPSTESASEKRKWILVGVGIGIGAGVGVLVLSLCGLVVIRFNKRKGEKPATPIREEEGKILGIQEELLGYGFSQGIRDAVVESLAVYKIEDLQIATGYFSEDHRIRGSVYRAVINGDNAAVKRMKGDVSNEIDILKRISHSNVIRLSGFCLHEGNTYLVYEYAENGSLSDQLHEQKQQSRCLSWKQRVQIAYDVSDGLNYLHNYANPQCIHKDLKSSNILLDGNFRAKVANFGLARRSEEEGADGVHITRHVVGTQGYMAPEYLEHGLVTPKLDVFALGVVMLELLSGRAAATSTSDGEGKEGDQLLWASIGTVLEGENVRGKLKGFIDPCLQREYPFELAFTMAQLAMKCVAHDPSFRPSIVEVLISLSKILSSSLDWDTLDNSKSSSAVFTGR
ncbi:protein LYK5-like protein [Cinnamomum micranthum f. kanehirae]|uniref:Protein LYK5-like protein n=1 Tax=Cinnamomum micranthum f. kanehirae TaxID=337451 RepID=A0A443N2P6_9MAGN|nr:protein LYK5-like protein [Cinnamomum micranthum f. kanehirae]